jgi:bacterioferritin (cytochrome b1)
MTPSELSRKLNRLASSIEGATKPSMSKIRTSLAGLLMAVEENDGFTVPAAQIITHLIEWQNAKYTIDIAYRNFADRVKSPWRDALADHWYKHAEEERANAYNLSMKIISLGSDPTHTNIQIPPCPATLAGFCATLMDLEIKAIEKGKQAAAFAGENASLRVFAEDIILVDSQHLDDLKRWCSDFGL